MWLSLSRILPGRSTQTTCALEVIAGEDQLDAAKRRVGALELPRHHLELVEELPADHRYLVNDEHLRMQSQCQANSMGVFPPGGGSGQGHPQTHSSAA